MKQPTRPLKRASLALTLLLPAVLAGACGGNYSNEDIDYQNAAPAAEEIAPKLQAIGNANSSQLFLDTQDTLRGLNGLLDMILGAVDNVRRYPATSRGTNVRVWGPFDGEEDPTQRFRVVISKIPTPVTVENELGFKFEYAVQVAHKGMEEVWTNFVTGWFAPQGGVRRGRGHMELSLANLRAAGFPVRNDDGVQTFSVTYETLDLVKWDAVLTVLIPPDVTAAPGTPPTPAEGRFKYVEAPSANQATFSFEWSGGTDPFLQAAQVSTTWRLSDSAGRADFLVTEGAAMGMRGVDCWGPDTVATYVHRDWNPAMEAGSVTTCVFPAP